MQERESRARTRKDDGLAGVLTKWGPAGAIILSVAIFSGKIAAIPEEVAALKLEVSQQKQINAVQDEQVKNIVNLLTEIRDDLRESRNRRR